MKCFDIQNIKGCEEVKEQLSELLGKERDNKRVSSREFIGGCEGHDEEDEFESRKASRYKNEKILRKG